MGILVDGYPCIGDLTRVLEVVIFLKFFVFRSVELGPREVAGWYSRGGWPKSHGVRCSDAWSLPGLKPWVIIGRDRSSAERLFWKAD